jgi:hypothetical protein
MTMVAMAAVGMARVTVAVGAFTRMLHATGVRLGVIGVVMRRLVFAMATRRSVLAGLSGIDVGCLHSNQANARGGISLQIIFTVGSGLADGRRHY